MSIITKAIEAVARLRNDRRADAERATKQAEAMEVFIQQIRERIPNATIIGHGGAIPPPPVMGGIDQGAVPPLGNSTLPPRMTWVDWQATMKDHLSNRPGWSPCQTAVQTMHGNCLWLVAVVRGSFSVHNVPLDYCEHDDTGLQFNGNKVFSVVSQIFHGGQLGVFEDRDLAMQCAELAERTCDWYGVTDEQKMIAYAEHTHRAWKAFGLTISPTQHVHHGGDTEPVFIMGEIEKPTVLS